MIADTYILIAKTAGLATLVGFFFRLGWEALGLAGVLAVGLGAAWLDRDAGRHGR